MRRREVLSLLALSGLGACDRPRPSVSLETLIDRLLVTRDSLALSAESLGAGAPPERLLAAAFLAPILSGGDGEDVHMMLVLPSLAPLIDPRARDGLLPCIFGVWNARLWCRAARTARRSPRASDPRALSRALAEGDAPRAGACAEALALREGAGRTAARLRLEACAPREDVHGAIFAAQASRMLASLPVRHRPAVLRSLASYLARSGPPRAPAPRPFAIDTRERAGAGEVAEAIRHGGRSALPAVSARAAWGGLALLAGEMIVADDRAPSGLGLHRVTLVDALHYAFARARAEERAQILGCALEWVPAAHARLVAAEAPALAALEPEGDGFAPGERTSGLTAARRALPTTARSEAAFVERARAHLRTFASGEHDYKLWAAAESLAPLLDGEARARFLAAAASAHVFRQRSGWDRAADARALLSSIPPRGPAAR